MERSKNPPLGDQSLQPNSARAEQTAPPDGWVARQSTTTQWIVVVLLSAAFSAALIAAQMPASMLVGPMLAGILVTALGGRLKINANAYSISQGIIGCMIVKMLPKALSGQVATQGWGLFAVGVLAVIALSGLLGWWMTREGIIPGTTAVWGMSPGAATAMTLMAESNGADTELVALMQYLRVAVVAVVSGSLLRLWGGGFHSSAAAVPWFPELHWLPFVETLALAVAGPLIARRFQISAGGLFVPLILGIILVRHGVMTIELPRWLLVVAYAVFGWRIGLRFTRRLLHHAARLMPRLLLATFSLVVLCAGVGALISYFGGIDPRTAYLATSPGGADTIAIIAASSHVNVAFVMTMQVCRFIAVIIIGPRMARYFVQHAKAGPVVS